MRRLGIGVAGVLVLLAGCGSAEEPGAEVATDGAAESSRPQLPPRPQEVDLTGLTGDDTCALLTDEQQAQLGMDREPNVSDSDRFGNPRCNFGRSQSEPRFAYQLKAVTQEDVTVYLDGSRLVTARVVEAAGFPAVENRRPTDERGCFVDVSTMDGQYLSVQYDEPFQSAETPAEACEKARVVAEMAMTTLLAQR